MTASVTTLDVGRVESSPTGPLALVQRRLGGTYELDPWGLDPDATRLVGRLGALRWRIRVTGLDNLPGEGPALLVANRRLGFSEPAVAAVGILRATGRFVRPAGGFDVEPIGGWTRRFGALPPRVDEVDAALRVGEFVLVPTRRELVRNRAGNLPIELLEPAVRAGVPVIPVAVCGREIGWTWTVAIGPAVHARGAPGPRAVGEVAVGVADHLAGLLHELRGRSSRRWVGSLLPGVSAGASEADRTESGS